MSDNKRFTYQKYGLFVHYVPGLSVDSKGMTYPPEQTADAFDVEGFARDVASTGAEYVIFTAWHAGMYLLYPSPVMENYCPGRSVRRDLVGELIEALHRYGIAVWLYTHPYLGYHLTEEERIRTGYGAKNDPVNPSFPDSSTFCHERWNEFVCAVYGELAERYGSKLDGLFMDEGTSEAKMADYVDFPRLRRVILERAPGLLLMQNFYGTPYACDLGMKEYGPGWGEFRFSPDRWPCYEIPVTVVCSEDWMAKKPAGQKVLRFNPEDMFRYTVLQASTNHDGGGVCWAAGPYVDGGWEDGVLPALQKVGEYYAKAGPSLRGTVPGTAYPTVSGTNLSTLPHGVAATRSADGSIEYLHVMKPPADGKPLLLPNPADGSVFSKAFLMDGSLVEMKVTESGLELIPGTLRWDPVDTVICLSVSERNPQKQVKRYVRDTDPAIRYLGDWSYSRWERNCGDYEGDVHITNEKEASVEYMFSGNGIACLMPVSPEQDTFTVYLDDECYGEFSAYNSNYIAQQQPFCAHGLPDGEHRLKLINSGNGALILDGLIVYQSLQEETE